MPPRGPRRRTFAAPGARKDSRLNRMISTTKLVVRSGKSLTSERIGDLLSGVEVLILDQTLLKSGVTRARVGVDSSPRGVCVNPMGWVTAEKDGEIKLAPLGSDILEALQPEAHGGPAQRLRVSKNALDPSFTRLEDNPASAARMARKRIESIDRRTVKAATPRSVQQGEVASKAETAEGLEEPASTASRMPAAPKPRKTPPPSTWQSVQGLKAKMDAVLQAADAADAKGKSFDTLEAKLGRLLVQKGVKVEELIVEWDRNNDGQINKLEFRVNVRKLGLSEAMATTQQIDSIFDGFDADRGGQLELSEIKAGLKRLQNQVSAVRERAASVGERAEVLRKLAQLYQDAIGETENYNIERHNYEQMVLNGTSTPSMQLGFLLKTRTVKVGDVVAKWDKDGDGSIDRSEYIKQLSALGFKASAEDMSAVFDTMDGDGSGELDLDEVMASMKRLISEAIAAKSFEDQQEKVAARAKRKAQAAQRTAQLALHEDMENDEIETATRLHLPVAEALAAAVNMDSKGINETPKTKAKIKGAKTKGTPPSTRRRRAAESQGAPEKE